MISIGNSEAVLACSLMAHKRGIPVVRIEAGDRQGSDEASLNALLIEQVAEMLFATNVPLAHRTLHQLGIMPERVQGVAGRLAGDVLAAVEPAMTTPYGAFLRHKLPMFLGPRWSTQVDGTAYAVIALDVTDSRALSPLMDVLLEVYAVSKLVWLLNASTRCAMEDWLLAHPQAMAKVSVIPEGRLSRADVDRRNSASILCCQVSSLPDQFSILRGAVCLLSEPGQLLADVSEGLDVPSLLRQGRRLTLLDPGHLPSDHVWGSIVLNDKIAQWVGRSQALLADLKGQADSDPMRVPSPRTTDPRVSPAQAISMRLQGWVSLRQLAHRASSGGAPETVVSTPGV
jgi:general secretion pathway protein A